MNDSRQTPVTAHHQVGRNVGLNWASYAFYMGISLVISPLMVHGLGDTAYGIWAFSLQLGAYVALLDVGIRTALSRFVTHHHAKSEIEQVHDALSVALTILSGVGIFGLLLTLVLAHFLPELIHVPAELQSVARLTLVLTGIQVSLSLPGAVFGMLAALSRYDLLVAADISMTGARALLLWLALTRGYGLIGVAVVFLATQCGTFGLQFWLAWRIYGGLRYRLRRGQFSSVLKPLLKFGFFASVLAISGRLVLSSDNLVIGMILGPAAITFYAIGGNLVGNLYHVLASSTSVVVPLAASLGARGEQQNLQALFARSSRFLLLLLLPAIIGLLVLGPPFIALWMGNRYVDVAGRVLILLAIPYFFWPMRGTATQVLLGTNRHRFIAYLSLIEAAANLGLSVFLAYRIGVVGVAWGTLVPAVLVTGIFVPSYTLRRLEMKWQAFYWNSLVLPLLAGVPYAALLWLLRSASVASTWIGFLVALLAPLPLYFLFVWFQVLRKQEKDLVRHQVRLTLRTATS